MFGDLLRWWFMILGRASALEAAIGIRAVRALAAKFPGQRIYIPFRSDTAMERFMENFSPLIGADRVATLFDMFGGLRIIVPSVTKPERSKGFVPVNVERVAELTEAGLTASQIAGLLKCNPRSVHGARTKAREMGILA